jgi:hypothetical protein
VDTVLQRRRERWLAVGIAVALIVFRSVVLTAYEGSHFDSDQAFVGLMARHLIDGRAFPVFNYGHPYMLGVEAWLAVPMFLIGGATVPMLILPLALMNLTVAVLLVLMLERAAGLRPLVALVPASFFALAAPGTATLLLEASGANIEPFLYVLLLWWLRRRPLAFGAVLGFGVLHREFTIFAFSALALLWLLERGWRRRGVWRDVAVGGLACGAVWQIVYLLKQFSSVDGPGTSAAAIAAVAPLAGDTNVSAVASHVCIDASTLPVAAERLWTVHLTSLLGAAERPMTSFGINSHLSQGADWLGPVIAALTAGMIARLLWLLARDRRRIEPRSLAFPSYLLLVGAQSLASYGVFRCGVIADGTMRYGLLGLFAPIGLTAAYLVCERRSIWRAAAIAATIVIATVSVRDHARLLREYVQETPPNWRREMADYLVQHGVRFAHAGFWDAYSVTFLTGERVIVASDDVVFIREYQWLVAAHPADAVSIVHGECPDGSAMIGSPMGPARVCAPPR